MGRRNRVKTVARLVLIFTLIAIISSFGLSCQSNALTKLTILHTNDTHSNLDAMSRIATKVNQIRAEKGDNNVLLLDSGNVFTGTLYFTLDQGQSDSWFMKQMGYEAMGLGGHEFDKGPAVLANFVSSAGFPVLCTNFDFSNEPLLAGKVAPWAVVQKGKVKYGVFALTPEDTAQLSSPGKNIIINDHIQAAQQAVSELRKQGIDKIIALTSIGWDKDIELAEQVTDIDIIIGGRSGTVPGRYPKVVYHSDTPTLIVQAGSNGGYLGQLNVNFDKQGVIKNWDGSFLITIDESLTQDAACLMKLEEYKQPIEVLLQTKVGESLVDLNGERANVRSQETNLGNLVADAMVSQTVSFGTAIAIVNGGAIRSSIPAGDISLGQIREVMPYGNYLVVLELIGRQIVAALENGVSQVADGAGRFPQVSGLRYIWNPEAAVGSRIVSVEVKSGNGYKPIDLAATYPVVTSDFLAKGGDGYTVFQEAINVNTTGFVDYETLRDYIQNNSPLHPGIEGRIIQIMNVTDGIGESFNGQAIEVKAGETFQIKLESNATTGYSWQLAGISDSAVTDIIGSVYIGPETPEGEMPLMGAPGTELWSFQALKAGISKITLEYRRPWESNEEPARQFNLIVVVK